MKPYNFAIIGGGIVGLATGMTLSERCPGARILVVEKENDWGRHQTGHNSGVIHSGIYYRPGSLKARFARDGNARLVAFCQAENIPHEVCGKVIVATEPDEIPRLDALEARGRENDLEVARIGPDELRTLEPHARGLAALHVFSAGIVDYGQVARAYARRMEKAGGDLRTGTRVVRIVSHADALTLETSGGAFTTRFLIGCAGLHSDRIAALAGVAPPARIVPFRGEYYELTPSKRHLVRSLIYPVPNPDFPFLGVHFTRMMDGSVHAGPNAVLGARREGYRKTDFSARDLAEIFAFPGFWRLARKHAGEGAREIWRSLSKAAFVRSLQRLVPTVTARDIIPTHAGVRAQALLPDGRLVDDFLIASGPRSLHVLNAPSPAATASLAIGGEVAARAVAASNYDAAG